jgi:hypothetical protein
MQLRVKGQEAREVPLLRIHRALSLAGHLGAEVVLGEGHETRLGIPCPKGQNVMLKIFDRFEGVGWRHFPPFHAIIYNRRAVLL